MASRRGIVLILLVLAGLPGLASACGSSGGGGTDTASSAEQAWQAGLRGWSHEMRAALDKLSRIFASPASVRLIERSQRQMNRRLATLEQTLDGCTDRLERLGPPPDRFALAHSTAVEACDNLERGSKLVRAGVKDFQGGRGVDTVTASTQPLSDGQEEIVLATSQLASAR